MKKEKTSKPKEFAVTPFRALKGVTAAPLEQPAVAPPPRIQKTNDDDRSLFHEAMTGVEPLTPRKKQARAEQLAAAPPPKRQPPGMSFLEREAFLSALRQMKLDVSFRNDLPVSDKKKQSGRIDHLQQLEKGKIPLSYELDLQGLSREEAVESLEGFITSALRRKQKAVLIITGTRGNAPADPMIRSAVASWLKEQRRTRISEFAPAPGDLGGDGAFVVFLKSTRGSSG